MLKVVILALLVAFASPSLARVRKSAQCGHKELSILERNAVQAGFSLPKEQWFTQKLDHFNHQDERTWKQLYYVNETFWKPGGPIFFQVGGEGAISPGYVSYFAMATYARQYGALQVALEHRFYGKSRPFPNLETANLAYLSSQQALADAAYFIESFKAMVGAEDSTPVVTFGCSYPGSLAAWFRLKYPHVTLASVASSAPVQAELDFYQYLDVVDRSLSFFTGPQCDSIIQTATQQIQALLRTRSGQSQLAQLFNWCSPVADPRDIPTFMSSLMGVWQGLVQYNDERQGSPDINYLCHRLVQGASSPLAAYAKLSLQMLVPPGECLDISYASSVAQIANTSYSDDDVGIRQWIYQSCTEFGYFQTTDGGDAQPFGDLVPTKYWLDQCTDAFGRAFDTEMLINDTNVYYGGNSLKSGDGSNVLFVNGNIDPWSSLSITQNIDDTLQAIFINGTAHCANVMQLSESSPPSLVDAQKRISAQIGAWLSNSTQQAPQ